MTISRRAMLAGLGGACAAAVGACRRGATTAGECPSLAGARIRWIVPNAAGGGYDTESRLLEPFLERALGAEIVIDNVPGAGGIAGARALAGARPDGRTLGFMGMPGLLVAALAGDPYAPPPRAFTVLGRFARSFHVWATGRESPFRTLQDVVTTGGSRPIVFGVNEVGSPNFVSIAVSAALCEVEAALVPGFSGTRQATLAALAGDVDLVCFNFESIRDLVIGGELRVLLQVADSPIDPHASLAGVPLLAGPSGVAVARARTRGGDDRAAARLASALVSVMSAGRVVVAPAGLPDDLAACLARVAGATLASDALRRASRRAFDPAGSADATRAIAEASAAAPLLLPLVQRARRTAGER